MDTQSVFYLAIVVNVVVLLAVLIIPRVFGRTRPARPVIAAGPTLPHASVARGADPGQPWFPARADGPTPRSLGSAAEQAVDPATGLGVAPSWARWLAEEEARVQRFRRPATIVLVELTGHDRLAERLGDEAAGRLIPPIAKTMRRYARATDQIARLGPTRFAALLTETDEVQAINYVERIRSACDVWLEAGAVTLRLSIGWAELGPDHPKDVALGEAERRLFIERERIRTQLLRSSDERTVEMSAVPQTGT